MEVADERISISSVTLTRNAKGQVQHEIKIYDPDPEKAKATAVKLFDELTAKYPYQG
jgi:hypothetical protein